MNDGALMVEKSESADLEAVKGGLDDVRARILAAMLPEVAFDGWSEAAFLAALKSADVSEAEAHVAFARGALDVAVYMHKAGDEEMVAALPKTVADIQGFSAKIEAVIVLRLELAGRHKEAVRQAAALMAIPQNARLSTQLIWHTADAIWRALGDVSTGFTYYSKRTTLSAVYSSSFLYWLQDSSENLEATRGFVHRRIADVGQFGKFTAKFKPKAV